MSEIEKKEPPKSFAASIKDILEARKDSLAQILPRHLTADRLIKVSLNCIAKVPLLATCSASSLIQCIITCAELGLEPGGALGHAYLVPYGKVCTLIIGYRGFIELARRSGQLSQIEAHVVHENDTFDLEFGLEPKLRHLPNLKSIEAGKPLLVYCIARLKDGSKHVEVMTWPEVQGIKKRSRAASSGPWVTDEEEMARKTVVRRAAKYLPLSTELASALEADSEDYVEGEVVVPKALPQDAAVVAQTIESATTRAHDAVKRKLQIKDVEEAPKPTPPPAPVEESGVVDVMPENL